MSSSSDGSSHPRIKRGIMVMATKDSVEAANVDRLLADSYMGRHVTGKPDYWAKLLEMLYGEGRLRKYAGQVEDIVDKFSFLLLARDQIASLEEARNADKRFTVKYFVYTFVFLTKSLLDSLAVFVNDIFDLRFGGGDIDLKRKRFVAALADKDRALGSAVGEREQWIAYVAKYRDNLIHRHGLYVGALPTVPENMTDPQEIDAFILREPHYMPTDPTLTTDQIIAGREAEFIKVTEFVTEWLQQALDVFDAVLKTFAIKFEVVRSNCT